MRGQDVMILRRAEILCKISKGIGDWSVEGLLDLMHSVSFDQSAQGRDAYSDGLSRVFTA